MKNIIIFSSTRAEYGLLEPIFKKLCSSKMLKVKMVITGTNVKKEFEPVFSNESTFISLIEKLPYRIYGELDSDIAKTYNEAFSVLLNFLSKSRPDLVLILGDRYEIHSLASVCNILNIPIAHFHGGEITEGAIDNNFRHSISKLSHIHFVSSELSKKRLIQMGEEKKNIFKVGACCIQNIKKKKLKNKKNLTKDLDLVFLKKTFLVTLHPETLGEKNNEKNINTLLLTLSKFKNTTIIFSGCGHDQDFKIIERKILNFVKNNNYRYFFKNLGQINFLSILKVSDIMIGNSSSGIFEAPLLKTPTLNIGLRQKGRELSRSIFCCNFQQQEIMKNIEHILDLLKKNRIFTKNIEYPYYGENLSQKVKQVIERFDLTKITLKKFHDYK